MPLKNKGLERETEKFILFLLDFQPRPIVMKECIDEVVGVMDDTNKHAVERFWIALAEKD